MKERSPIVVYGGGGHGRVILDALARAGRAAEIVGVIDDGQPSGARCAGYPVLGGEQWLTSAERVSVER